MSKTISVHNGSAWSRGHNIRDERYIKNMDNIDSTLSCNNVIIKDEPVRKAYERIFGEAVKQYNDKQKRSDRCIDDYYNKIVEDKRKHPVYELIVQIGDHNDTGHQAEKEKQALLTFAQQWEQRNPNLQLIGAYIHCDEPNGTVHMHCDYIPVAECNRGMAIQNSYDRALQQQGFTSTNVHKTAQVAWEKREREALNDICNALEIDAQHSQGIGDSRPTLSPKEYGRARDEMRKQIEKEFEPYIEQCRQYQDVEVNHNELLKNAQKKTSAFSKKTTYTFSEEEYRKVSKQIYSALILQNQKKELDDREKRLETMIEERSERVHQLEREQIARENELNSKELQLIRRADELEEERKKLEKLKDESKKEYQRNKNAVELLNAAENENKKLNEQLSAVKLENKAISQIRLEEYDAMTQLARDVRNENREIIKNLEKEISSLKSKLSLAVNFIKNACKSMNMMLDKRENEYALSQNDSEQRTLLETVKEIGVSLLESMGFKKAGNEANSKAELSEEIEDAIEEKESKYHSRGGMHL